MQRCVSDPSKPIQVLIADDSTTVRGMLRHLLEKEDGIRVIAAAHNGKITVELYKKLKPDAVILDIEMPEMNGIDALREILSFDPQAKIIICSSQTQIGAKMTIQALHIGAIDCLLKPSATAIDTGSDFGTQLITRLYALANYISPITATLHPRTALSSFTLREFPSSLGIYRPQAIAFGASTGGPKALAHVLSGLDKNGYIPPIFITQHIPAGFTQVLAESFKKSCGLPTFEAQNHMQVQEKTVYLAAGGQHMTLVRKPSGVFIQLSDALSVNFCKPSVDVMMDSLLETYKSSILSVMLTGMGSDGLESCRRLINTNHQNLLIAQDEGSSAVWGMPGAVAKAGLCHAVLPLDAIAAALNKIIAGQQP